MKAAQVLEHIRDIIDGIDGVKAVGRRALYAAVPTAALATSGCVGVYGMPFADYVLDGTVVSAETGDPVPGIEVEFSDNELNRAIANAEGRWAISITDDFECSTDCDLVARDIDGDENGAFEAATNQVSLNHTDEGDGDWDEGRWELHDVVIVLEPSAE